MEAAAGINYFTDGNGHSLSMTQQAWGELGSELVENGEFIYWTDPTIPDDWGQIGTHDVNNYVEENTKGCRIVSDGTYVGISQSGNITSGALYEYSIYVYDTTSGGIELAYGASAVELELGLNVFQLTPSTSTLSVKRNFSLGTCDCIFGDISVREVNPVMNNNLQYWFCPTAGLILYKTPRTVPEAAEVEYFLYKKGCFEHEVLIDAETGEVLYDEVSGKLIFDEEA